jgi:hypothetical protein
MFGDQFLKIINHFFLSNDMSIPHLILKKIKGRQWQRA